METIDWSMGEVVAALERTGLSEDTLIISLPIMALVRGSSGIYRSRKGNSWEGGQRVPFIASWPGTIPAGMVTNEPAMNIDLFPTMVALAGGELPTDRPIDGRNILPMLTERAPSPHEALFLFDNDRLVAVRSGKWKLGSSRATARQ